MEREVRLKDAPEETLVTAAVVGFTLRSLRVCQRQKRLN